jgi:dUTP pyrophosphatase
LISLNLPHKNVYFCQFSKNRDLNFETKPMKVRIVNASGNDLPEYATNASAGMDLRANLDEPVVLKPLQRAMIPTGIFIELPIGFEAQIRPRSGFAAKHGITVLNTPGTVDADYRGEIKVILVNLSDEAFEVTNGERIAQMVISAHAKAEWEQVDELNETSRGAGGFGHTGRH